MKEWFKSIIIVIKYSTFPVILKVVQAIVTALMVPFQLFCIQKLVEVLQTYIVNQVNFQLVLIWAIMLVLTHLFSSNIHFLNTIFDISIKKNLNDRLPNEIIQRFSQIDYSCFENSQSIDILEKIGNKIQEKILQVFNDTIAFFSIIISIIGVMVVISQISWLFSIIFVVILYIIMLIDYKSMYIMNNMFFNQTPKEREMNYYCNLLSDKKSLFEMKVFLCMDYIKNKWYHKNQELFKERIKINRKSQKYFFFSSLMNLIWIAIVIIYTICKLKYNEISLGLCISVLGSALTLLSLVENTSYVFSNLTLNSMYIKYYIKFNQLPLIHTKQESNLKEANTYTFEFINVSFKYPNTEKYVLKELNLKFNTNEKIALVGENGAGKSTIIKLICKLYQPNEGNIYINGVNINDISYHSLHKIFSVVFQNFVRYNFTIRENIALEKMNEMNFDDLMKKIMKEINLEDRLIDNLDISLGKVEEDGIDLSTGQWQKLAIARCLFARSNYAILDEPTASLDPISESNIYELFLNVINQKGSLIISHRLASAKLSDKIFVLKNGKISEMGTHEELMRQKGEYFEMFEKQSEWYK